ncbi:hypothetical protein HOE67_00675 [Candidatus Peregrinibacteria bacterium]|jgi:hypothetical protein|nr:hypothetical protein [Candidatus Peregrinibacteria bacterium]MBT4055603.1 hypothetical protein [Candidatus Peregrinibacteria bacterium]
MTKLSVPLYERILIPEGTYDATVKGMEITESKFNGRDQVVICFQLLTPPFPDRDDFYPNVYSYYNLSLHPKSSLLKKFIKPLYGRIPQKEDCDGIEFSLNQFIDSDCEITIEHREKEDGDICAVVSKVNKQGGQE